MFRRLRLVILISTIWWTAYALLFAADVVSIGQRQGITVSWQEAAIFSFGGWLTWIPISVALYLTVSHFPLQRGQIVRSAAVLMTAVLATVLIRAIYVYVTNPLFTWYLQPPDFGVVLWDSLTKNFMLGWAVVGAAHALLFYNRAREREIKVAELEASLASARLQAISARLNPHFMFNALNSVSEMVHRDPEAADDMLVALSHLLRESLSTSGEHERALSTEIEVAKDYLMIEAYRLGDRLRVEWRIDDDCLSAMTPVLILQPLLENAIIHSIARSHEPGWLRITANARDGQLHLTVDNSRPADESPSPGYGIGLESVVTRLSIIHGDRASFAVDASVPDVFSARLVLPLSSHKRQAA